MQHLILSDLHANWSALEAVLADAKGSFDQIICCGDIVGYNAEPAPVLEWAKANCAFVIRGNHDKVVAGIDDLEWFNPVAQAAVLWTHDQLVPDQLTYLHDLIKGPLKLDDFYVWHGAPFDEDEYVLRAEEAATCFPHFDLPLAFFGHTHIQGGFFSRRGRVSFVPKVAPRERQLVIELENETSYMINPGAVGQPRDGDPRAAYAIFDSDQKTVTLRRATYDIEKAVTGIQQAGLPDALWQRLFHGA